MKTRDELPVPERWGADRVTFHFAPQASGMLASSVLWMAMAAVGGGGVTTGLVGVLGTAAGWVAGEGASIGVGLPAAMFALFAGSIPVAVFAFVGWARTLGPSRLVVSTADLQLGLEQPPVRAALESWSLTEPERRREVDAAGRATRELEPLRERAR